METLGASLEAAGELVAGAQRVTVLTGAGISTESGIPDFRGPNGVWTKDPAAEKLFTLQNYLVDPDMRKRAWQARLEHGAWTAKPNAGHRAIVELERRGKLRALGTLWAASRYPFSEPGSIVRPREPVKPMEPVASLASLKMGGPETGVGFPDRRSFARRCWA
ncbi:MAG: hypothetical protein GEU78_04110 [Actinobacteria bacterium]|nr:hypothetical protein [Actinomycetota bacterium]